MCTSVGVPQSLRGSMREYSKREGRGIGDLVAKSLKGQPSRIQSASSQKNDGKTTVNKKVIGNIHYTCSNRVLRHSTLVQPYNAAGETQSQEIVLKGGHNKMVNFVTFSRLTFAAL